MARILKGYRIQTPIAKKSILRVPLQEGRYRDVEAPRDYEPGERIKIGYESHRLDEYQAYDEDVPDEERVFRVVDS